MKRCPTCQKDFPDSMRFCQTDGTPLVEAAEKTPPPPPPDPYKTVVGGQIKMDPDLLDIPAQDPMKTMVSPISVPKSDPPKPEPPKPANDPFSSAPPPLPKVESKPDFPPPPPLKSNEPSLSPPYFGDLSPKSDPPSSPFGSPFSNEPPKSDSPFGKQSGMGGSSSSPFDKPASSPQQSSSPFDKAPPPPYKEPEPKFDSGAKGSPFGSSSPFDSPSSAPFGQQQNDWTPPPAPVSNWQDQGLGANTPFQPPVAGAVEGANKTLAIVSLVCGILSICLCGILSGIPALITGFMAKGKIDSNPAEYGGRGMAIAGMVTGAIGTVFGLIGIIYWIVIVATGGRF